MPISLLANSDLKVSGMLAAAIYNQIDECHIAATRKKANTKDAALMLFTSGNQIFGSILRCCSSLRIIRLIQAAKDSSPSCRCASSIKSRNSGSRRNWNGGLPRLVLLCVDTLSTLSVKFSCVVTHYMHINEKATPRSAVTLPRRLTTTLEGLTPWLPQSVPTSLRRSTAPRRKLSPLCCGEPRLMKN